MPRIRYSPEVRSDILRRVQSGELSHAQAAREVGCSLRTIQQWIHPCRHNTSLSGTSSSQNSTHHPVPSSMSHFVPDSSGTSMPRHPHDAQASFIPIRLTDTRSATLELTIPSGTHLRLIGVTSDFVIEVLKTLS